MSADNKRHDLASIEPITPAPGVDEAEEQRERADRVGFVAAASAGSPPAVGVAAEQADDPLPDSTTESAKGQPR